MEAWRVILSCGRPEEVPSFDKALATESNGYVCGELLDLAACLPAARLPARAAGLLAGRSEGPEWQDSELLSAYIGAIRAAHGAGTREAFEAMLTFRPLDHGVLISLVRALADTAAGLSANGDHEPVERLFTTALGTGESHTREAAGGAIGMLLAQGRLSANDASRAVRL